MREIYIVLEHYDESKDVVFITADWDEAVAKEKEIDENPIHQYATIVTMELAE